MEYCGYGALTEPLHALEFFVALSRQKKPVELYFYPHGEHVLDTPAERMASLQRNVDWFRFWMQGFERPGAEDPDQYARWRALRELYRRNERNSVSISRDAEEKESSSSTRDSLPCLSAGSPGCSSD
jgi:hypothetical protein